MHAEKRDITFLRHVDSLRIPDNSISTNLLTRSQMPKIEIEIKPLIPRKPNCTRKI